MTPDREQRIKLLAVETGGPLAAVVDQLLAELKENTPLLMEAVRADRDLLIDQYAACREELRSQKELTKVLTDELAGTQPSLATASQSIINLTAKAEVYESEAEHARAERTAVLMQLDTVSTQLSEATTEISRLRKLTQTLTEDRNFLSAKLSGYENPRPLPHKG